jgi:integrase
MSLSDVQCKTAKPREKKYKIFDGEGLYLEVHPSGSRYWRLKYRVGEKEKRFAIGVYPEISLVEARKAKIEIRSQLKSGIDPVLAKFQEKQVCQAIAKGTFEAIALEWHEKNNPAWDEKYATTVKHRLEKYVFPFIGKLPIQQIKPIAMLGCLQRIEKTAPDMARRIKQICSQVFKYAIVTDRLDSDPSYGLEVALKRYRRGHFAAISVDELPKFIKDLCNYEPRLKRQTFLAIKMMLLTFVRTKELIHSTWDEFDIENKLWVIPAERMKMRSPHLVPLSSQVLSILSELKELNPTREYVFPSISKPKKPMSTGTILVALGRMGYRNRMTGHGFRSLALGALKEKLGYNHEIADRQLAHVPRNGTDRAYDRAQFLRQRTEMMQSYANYVALLIE